MAEHIAFQLVTPVKKLIDKAVTMVTVPGSEGDLGVLPGHAPLIANLRPGVLEVYEGTRIIERIFVSGGFVEITVERCTVLAQEATHVADLARHALEESIKQLTHALAEAKDDATRSHLAAKLSIVQAKAASASIVH